MLYNGKKRIVSKTRFSYSLLSKFIGLMFSSELKDECMIFFFEKPTRVDLHMFFVFYPIDVVFLDEDKKVIEKKENFRPFTFYSPKHKSSYVIELPWGHAKDIKIGDTLRF